MATTLAAIAAYVSSALNRSGLAAARVCYHAMIACVVAASVYLMYLILNNRYDIRYVSSYSSVDLPLVYKVSAFWAGQEGTLLLWALSGSVIGVALRTMAKDLEPWLMALWSAIQAFFFALLLIKSPFVAATGEFLLRFPNGHGLSSLLQNFWMAVHPPVIFVGFAAMAVPAVFALAALVKGDYKTWCNRCFPWALFAWVTLGAGMVIGSFWAYEVLGWGGYWSWDPVENASLIPWLAVTALLHGMLVERYRGGMRRANMALALLSFLLVIYATFLTRSGVLGSLSVHSFEGTDRNSNAHLIGFMLFFAILSLSLLLWRWKEVGIRPSSYHISSRESACFIGVISLSAMALLILLGTSSPLIVKALTGKPSGVDAVYYGHVSWPVALILLVLLALVPLLKWSANSTKGTRSPALMVTSAILGLALVATAVVVSVAGTSKGASFAMCILAAIALLVNGWFAQFYARSNWRMLGGYLAHVGFALMLIGMVFSPSSTRSGDSNRVVLPRGDVVEALGYKFTLLDVRSLPNDADAIKIKVERDGRSFAIRSTMRPVNNEVIIHRTLLRDLYIAPRGVRTLEIEPIVRTNAEGREYSDAFTPDGGLGVRLMWARNNPKSGMAALAVQMRGQRPILMELNRGQSKPFGRYAVRLMKFNVYGVGRTGTSYGALLRVDYPGAKPFAVLDVSVKPLISLIWTGSIITLLGGLVAMVRRSGEARSLASSDRAVRRT